MQHKSAIIGYGSMAAWQVRYIRDNKITDILLPKGAFDIRPEALKKAEEDGLYAYKSLDELLADKEIDVVYIAAPNHVHAELSIKAMRSGKNVICEKPVAMNAAELEEIIKVRDETGKLFTVHHNRRWDNDFRAVKEIVESGMIGKPDFIESRVEGPDKFFHGWRDSKANGGGMLRDWGVHLIDQVMWIMKEKVVSVFSEQMGIHTQEVDDTSKTIICFENGTSAQIELLMGACLKIPRFRLMGKLGTVIVDSINGEGKIIKLVPDADVKWAEDIIFTAAGPTRTMAPRPSHTINETPLPDVKFNQYDIYFNIINAIEGKEELVVKPEECLRVLKVIELAFKSSEEGRSIACEI